MSTTDKLSAALISAILSSVAAMSCGRLGGSASDMFLLLVLTFVGMMNWFAVTRKDYK